MSDTALVWFRRDLRVRDQPTFLAAADAATRALALFVLDPALLDPSGAARRTVLYRSLRELDETLGGRLLVVRGDPADVVPRSRPPSTRGRCTPPPTSGPTGDPRRGREKALAEHGRELVRSGSPYAVAPGRVTKPDGDAVQGVHAVPSGLAAARLAAARRHRRPHPRLARSRRQEGSPRPDPRRRPRRRRAPRRGRGRGAGAVAGVPRRRRRRTTGAPATGPTGPAPRGCRCTSSTARCTRARCSPTSPGAVGVGSRPTHRARLARVLRRRPAPPPRLRAGELRPQVRRAALGPGPAAQEHFDAWGEGRTGFPIVDAGMRQLREKAWMHNRVRMIVRELPGQGPAPALEVGRPALHAAARRRRPGVEPARLAVDGGHRHRRGAVLPGVQPGHAGGEVRPGRRLRAALRPRAARRARQGGAPAVEAAGRAAGGYPAPIVDHEAERVEAFARYEQVKAGVGPDRTFVGAGAYPFGAMARCGRREADRRRCASWSRCWQAE